MNVSRPTVNGNATRVGDMDLDRSRRVGRRLQAHLPPELQHIIQGYADEPTGRGRRFGLGLPHSNLHIGMIGNYGRSMAAFYNSRQRLGVSIENIRNVSAHIGNRGWLGNHNRRMTPRFATERNRNYQNRIRPNPDANRRHMLAQVRLRGTLSGSRT